MQIILTAKATSRALDALRDATGIKTDEGRGIVAKYADGTPKWVYYIKGSCLEHTSRGGLVREILEQVNGWMLENGFVNTDILLNARCSAGFPMFKIVD